MLCRIVVLTDLHYAANPPERHPVRRKESAALLLERAVRRLNKHIRPDAVVLLGDLVDDGARPEAEADLRRIAAVLKQLKMPWCSVRGNHDMPEAAFDAIVGRAPDFLDVGGVRLAPFGDPEAPEYNAVRTAHDLERMAALRADFSGPIVTFHHVPLFPPGRHSCPFNYTNAEAVMAAMRTHGIGLAVGGHYHDGFAPIHEDGLVFACAPSLCEPPFRMLEIEIAGQGAYAFREQTLQLPESLGLVDTHIHTQFAYCAEDITLPAIRETAALFGLADVRLTEHSDQLYFTREACLTGKVHPEGIATPDWRERRMDAYRAAALDAGFSSGQIGLELECDYDGHPIVAPGDLADTAFAIGAIHRLPSLTKEYQDGTRACDEFMAALERFLACGIRVLAHPFRIFRRRGQPVPEHLFTPVARLLRENGVAAEINFHANTPAPEFVRCCLEAGVKLALGSDAHRLCDLGEFAPHLALLEECGCREALDEVLIRP